MLFYSFYYSLWTPTLSLNFLNYFPPEPDSYPNRETPSSTLEGSAKINVAERRRWKKEKAMKNADLIIFLML